MSDFVKIMHKAVAGSLVILAGVFVACEKDSADKSVVENSEYPRAETLYIGGFDWAPPTTFNPLDYDPNFPIDGNVRLMYETLVTYNQITDKLEPMLADSFTRTDSSIVVHLDKNAKWNNGTPVTVDDVIYSFHIDSILPTPRHGNWEYLTSVTADNSNNITFLFNKKNKNPLIILNAIAETSILPKSVFEPIIEGAKEGKAYNFGKVVEFKNDNSPVVSGPYNLKTFSPDKIVLERNDSYWGNVNHGGKAPAPKYIIHSLYNGNNHFNSAMTKGHLDVSSIFLPQIWNKAKDNIRAWSREEPYHLPGSITTLIINHQVEPFNDPAFRRQSRQASYCRSAPRRASSTRKMPTSSVIPTTSRKRRKSLPPQATPGIPKASSWTSTASLYAPSASNARRAGLTGKMSSRSSRNPSAKSVSLPNRTSWTTAYGTRTCASARSTSP